MFVNVSKKPYQTWSQDKMEAAKSFSDHIVNVCPPNNLYSMSDEDMEYSIHRITDGIVEKIDAFPNEPIDCILVDINDKRMTYQLVWYLHEVFGVRILCPVYKCGRVVRTVNGKAYRGSQYEFIGFKDY